MMNRRRKKEVVVFGSPNRFMTAMMGLAGVAFLFTIFLSASYNTGYGKDSLSFSPEVSNPEEGYLVSQTQPTQYLTSCDSALTEARSRCNAAASSCRSTQRACDDYTKCDGALSQCGGLIPPKNKTNCEALDKCFRQHGDGFTCGYKWTWEGNHFFCKGSIFCPSEPYWSGCPSSFVCSWQRECGVRVDKCQDALNKYLQMNCSPAQHTLQDLTIPSVPEKFVCAAADCH